MNYTDEKYFTPKEAKKTLPLVKQIVSDILACGDEVRNIVATVGEDADTSPEVKELMDKINKYIDELQELGCYYKDWNFSIGLIDFPSVIEGEEVMLCWRSDEPDVMFYHGVADGFAGRKLIPELYL